MKHTLCTSRKTAFTLIELLVVIAIIAILAAILFPVFGRARENARRSSCASQLKQLSLGFIQYTQDYDEFTMPYTDNATLATANGVATTNPMTSGTHWPTALNPYLKSRELYVCPSSRAGVLNSYTMNQNAMLTFVDYAGNKCTTPYPCIAGGYGNGARTGGRALASVENASLMPILTDSLGNSNAGNPAVIGQVALITFANVSTAGVRQNTAASTNYASGTALGIPHGARHMGGSNYAFFDGHVKWLKSNPNALATTKQPGEESLPMMVHTDGLDWDGDGNLGVGTAGD